MSSTHVILNALAHELGVEHTEGHALQMSTRNGINAVVQAAGDGALVIHALGAEIAGEEEEPYALMQALASNAPSNDGTPIHALLEDGNQWVVFNRLPCAEGQTAQSMAAWATRFLAQLDTTVPGGAWPAADARPHLLNLWQGLCEQLGLETSDDDLRTQPVIPDDGLPVTLALDTDSGDIELRAIVTVLPTELDDDTPYFRRLLQAHALGLHTGGAVFAIDADAQELVVWLRAPANRLTATDLAGLIEHISSLAAQFAP